MKQGDKLHGHCCDDCVINSGNSPKSPPDSGVKLRLCLLCNHYGIGSTTEFVVGPWLTLKVTRQSTT